MAEVVMEAAAEAAETKPAKKKAAADPGEELVTVSYTHLTLPTN